MLGDVPADGFGGADRLAERAPDLNEFGRADRLEDFAGAAHGLVEAANELGAEALRQGRASVATGSNYGMFYLCSHLQKSQSESVRPVRNL